MKYKITERHEEIRAKVRAFAEKEIKPIAAELDKEHKFPHEVVKKMGKMGLMGIVFPEEYGGAGLDYISYAIAVEELGRVDGGVSVTLSAHVSLACNPIMTYGTEEQKQKYLVPLAKGEKIGAFALTEPEAGSDVSSMETTAEFDGENYILNGGKIFISNAPAAETYVVFAVTSPELGTRGISAFIVEKQWEGFSFGENYDKLGIRSSDTSELIFTNIVVPKENLLGQEGQGFRIAMETLDGGRIGIAAQALGIAQGAFESALEYAKEREQFGKAIAFHQVISFKLADMATKLRACRFMVYSVAELKQNNEPISVEAAMAKQYVSDAGLEIVNDALQIYGGSGFIKGIDVERFYRDAKICTIYEGTNEIQRMVVAGSLIGREPKSDTVKGKKTSVTGERKKKIFAGGSIKDNVKELADALKKDGYDFSVGIPINTPIAEAQRVVSAGRGIGEKENMQYIEVLANQAGAAIGSSRPVAETLKYVPLSRYVGLTGQKFKGNLYIAVGISGAGQHLKGIKEAGTIVAINNNPNARIFKNVDYGIVGDFKEIIPLLAAEFDTGEPKKDAPPMKRMKRRTPKKLPPSYDAYLCIGCGYEYLPPFGDPEGDVNPGTTFDKLPDEWICPECGEERDLFIKE